MRLLSLLSYSSFFSPTMESRPLDDFSDEVLIHLLQFLPPRDLLSLSLTNRRFCLLCSDDKLWRLVLAQLDLNLEKPTEALLPIEIYKKYGRFTRRVQVGLDQSLSFDWVSYLPPIHSLASMNGYLYSNNGGDICKLDDQGRCVQTFKGHEKTVITLLCWQGRIYSGDMNGGIRRWQENGHSTIFEGQNRSVTSFIGYKGVLYSASGNLVRMWDEDGHCVKTLYAHGQVHVLTVLGDWLCAGCQDRRIRLWNEERVQVEIFSGPDSSVYSLTVFRGQLCSGSENGLICLWDPSGNVAAEFKGHTRIICSLTEFKTHLFSGSLDHTIRVWDAQGTCLHVFENQPIILSFSVYQGYLVAGSAAEDRKGVAIRLFDPSVLELSALRKLVQISKSLFRLLN